MRNFVRPKRKFPWDPQLYYLMKVHYIIYIIKSESLLSIRCCVVTQNAMMSKNIDN